MECNCGVKSCKWFFCRDRKICLIHFNSLPKDERMRINGITPGRFGMSLEKLADKSITDDKPLPAKSILRKVLQKTGGICWLCGKRIEKGEYSKDHLIPKSKGGKDNLNNLMPAHIECNRIRGNKDISPDEFIKLSQYLNQSK